MGWLGGWRAKGYESNLETVKKNLRTHEDESVADFALGNAGKKQDEGCGQVASCRFGLQPSGDHVDGDKRLRKQSQLLNIET